MLRHDGRFGPFPDSQRVASGARAELTSFGEAGSPKPQTICVDLVSTTEQGPGNCYLEDGDVVVVREREPRSIYVMGLVKDPGLQTLPPDRDLYVLNALAAAGGRTSQLADKVWVLREVPGEKDSVRIVVSIREAKRNAAANVRLQAGDIVSVEETPATFVFDLLRNFIRFGMSSSVPLF